MIIRTDFLYAKSINLLDMLLNDNSISEMEQQKVSGTQRHCNKMIIVLDKRYDCYDEPVENTTPVNGARHLLLQSTAILAQSKCIQEVTF
mgnify:CR=1 FL=1